MADNDNSISDQINQSADFYQPAVYELLSFYQSLSLEADPMDGQFIPMTTVQPWEQKRSLFFAVGLLPPASNVTGRLLDRSASIQGLQGSYEDLVSENPDPGSSSTGDLPGETGGVPTSTPLPVGPTQSDSDDFWVQFVVMCNRLGCQPEELARVIQTESGFNPAAGYVNRNGETTARGLIQFIRPTATSDRIGMTDEQYDNLQNTSALDQLQWVERYFKGRAQGRNAFELKAVTIGGFNNPDGSIYNGTATEPEFRNAARQRSAYLANQQLDGPPSKGYITAVDLNRRMAGKRLASGTQGRINSARRDLGMEVGYVPFQPDEETTESWQAGGSASANRASKNAAQVANKDLNQTNLGRQFMAQQQAMINAMQQALTQMANTPPLRLLVNPQSFRISCEKIISDGNWGRSGPIIEHWGESQDTIEASGKIAAFYSMDALNSSGPGLNRTARQFSASYQNLLSLWTIYKNNGGVWFPDPLMPSGARAKNLAVVGSVYLYYDHTLYIGSFNTFTLTESETSPFTLEYSFTFSVRATFLLDHLNDAQYTYGRPTPPQVPVSLNSSSPLTGGNNPQPSPNVAPPPTATSELDALLGDIGL